MLRNEIQENSGSNRITTQYSEKPKPFCIPLPRMEDVALLQEDRTPLGLRLYANSVSAGFPSPADDYIERKLDLNTHLIQHPSSTFFLIASGDSMKDGGIQSGDMLIVDKSIEASHGKIVIAAINGELTVKRLSRTEGRVRLLPANINYQPIEISENEDLVIWGVVTHVVHQAS